MKLNPKANSIRNLDLSEERNNDIEMKQQMISILKTKTGYTKDMELSKGKRDRRAKIQEWSNGNPEKIVSLKEALYTEKETRESNLCPFPSHKGYSSLWKTLTPYQQKQMRDDIRVTADGSIEMIDMKKKFSMLTSDHDGEYIMPTAYHDGEYIFDGSHIDKNLQTWVKWVTYLTCRAAEKEASNQGKKLLKDKSEVEQFISFFPGENTKEKIFNFVTLFGLEKAGCWNPYTNKWDDISSVGYVKLSGLNWIDNVYGVKWSTDRAEVSRYGHRNASPFLAYESLD